MAEAAKIEESGSRSDVAAAFDKVEVAQAKVEPVKVEPARIEPAKIEPAKIEPVKVEPAALRGEGEVKEPAKAETLGKVGEPAKAVELKAGEVKSDEAKWQDRLTKAPPSWKPEAHESWAQLPSNVRVEIHRRESEVYRVLQNSKEAREFHQEFQKVAQPYAMLIAQEGSPLLAFSEYLKTGSLLRMGTPHEKAMAVARAINQFQVPIELLDAALAGTLKAGNGAGGAAQFRDPRVDQLLGTLAEQQARHNQQVTEEVDGELEEFATDEKNKYFHDVRDLMADIMEVAARRNKKVSLQTAYSQAIMLHPEISKLVKVQETTQTEQKLTQAAQAAKAAAVSITGSPGAPGGVVASDGTVRGSIEAAIASLSGR